MNRLFDLRIIAILVVGLAARSLLYSFGEQVASNDWYVPFVSIDRPYFWSDPWSAWISSGGDPNAFPYGIVMWAILAIPVSAFELLFASPSAGYFFVLLSADVLLLVFLLHTYRSPIKVAALYWLCPLPIYMTYALGMNDVVVVSLLFAAILLLRRRQFALSGALMASAVSGKASMLLSVPFALLYLFQHRRISRSFIEFAVAFFVILSGFSLIYLFSDEAWQMFFGNPTVGRVLDLRVSYSFGPDIYIFPLIYVGFLYAGWSIRPLNFDLLMSLIGITFIMTLLVTPASSGWFLWAMPFLVFFQLRGNKIDFLLAQSFTLFYFLQIIYINPLGGLGIWNEIVLFFNQVGFSAINQVLFWNLNQTLLVASGLVFSFKLFRNLIFRDQHYRFYRSPFVIAISGDSGSGKDTLVDAIADGVGANSVVKLLGDDYHRWDRKNAFWSVVTHVNPIANNLKAFTNDFFRLLNMESVSQAHYDHDTGKMTKPRVLEASRFLLASGLHVLALPPVRSAANLKIFLDIDEDLRTYFKVRRDTTERGKQVVDVLASIQARMADSEKYIRPQREFADLVFSLRSLDNDAVKDFSRHGILELALSVTVRNSFDERGLQRVLVGVCGMSVELSFEGRDSDVNLDISGECSAGDIDIAASILCEDTFELFEARPQWQPGVTGIMQLIVFMQINEKFKRIAAK